MRLSFQRPTHSWLPSSVLFLACFSPQNFKSQSQLSCQRTAGGSGVSTERDVNSVQPFTRETLLPEEPSAVTRYAWASALLFLRIRLVKQECILNCVGFELFCECVTFQLLNVEVVLNSCSVRSVTVVYVLWCWYGVFVEAFLKVISICWRHTLERFLSQILFYALVQWSRVTFTFHSQPRVMSHLWRAGSVWPHELRISTLLSNRSTATEIYQCVCILLCYNVSWGEIIMLVHQKLSIKK